MTRDITYIKTRIASLKRDPVSNANLIRKWERILRKAERENNNET